MTKQQILGRNMGLRIVMLGALAPRWSVRAAKEAAGMSTAQWSAYRRGVSYVSDAVIARIAGGLGMRVVDLLGTPGRVIATSVPGEWLALPEREESPQPRQDAP